MDILVSLLSDEWLAIHWILFLFNGDQLWALEHNFLILIRKNIGLWYYKPGKFRNLVIANWEARVEPKEWWILKNWLLLVCHDSQEVNSATLQFREPSADSPWKSNSVPYNKWLTFKAGREFEIKFCLHVSTWDPPVGRKLESNAGWCRSLSSAKLNSFSFLSILVWGVCSVAQTLFYSTKWNISIEMLDHLVANSIEPPSLSLSPCPPPPPLQSVSQLGSCNSLT